MPRTVITAVRGPEQLAAAVAVWASAREAVGGTPTPERRARVEDPACGHVAMVFVDPGYWGSGLGGALVRALQAPPRAPRGHG